MLPFPAVQDRSAPSKGLADFTTDRRVLILIAMALCVGSAGAGAAWALIRLITLVTNVVWFGRFSTADASLAGLQPSLWMVAAPALGGLAIGLMARFGSEKIRGHGIPEAIEAILIGGSRLQPKVAVLKPLSSALSIGTGGPFGAEGPIIMTGGAIGSLFAQCFHLSAAERKTLLVAGAAAGMTAIFGTPVAALLLAVELLLFEWKPRSFLPVVAACLISAAWRPLLFGAGPLFPFADPVALPWWGLFACIGLGIVAGLQSGLMTVMLYKVEDLFQRLPIHWMWWPAIGGIAVGLGGLVEPRAMGVGYDVIRDLLAPGTGAREVLGVLVVKLIIWVVALGSGTSGGVLAPLLILGGASGWLLGLGLPGEPSLWALLGMAAMMGGTMRSPLTGIVFAVELTGNVDVLLPLLAATAASYAVTVLLLKRSILTEKIARRGHHLTREYSTDPFELLRASDVMVTAVDTMPGTMTVDEAIAFFRAAGHRHKSYPLVDRDRRVIGMVGRTDVLRWSGSDDHAGLTLYDAVSDRSVVVAPPDIVLGRLVDLMIEHDVSRVPIVDPADRRLLGLVARKDLFKIRSNATALENERTAYFGQSWRRPA
ncbi:chloride channel protein [Azospirillum sp. YIM B02556]|uniref:Chloride channel protein n=1 Tax=Azospirillum endophyticum TaxID=2800326 RepID=A0ABS1FFH6_9PROT|nr:chloride channel protein [Azospirillum endophyticum]MBK1842183.1 chloride channel protein [Azospirillum endophyticum]